MHRPLAGHRAIGSGGRRRRQRHGPVPHDRRMVRGGGPGRQDAGRSGPGRAALRGDGPGTRPFFYILGGNIEAVRLGRWKLHVRKWTDERFRLYDLETDIGERHDVLDEQPEVVADLLALIDGGRADLGDDATDVVGAGVRPVGRVTGPVTLTNFDPDTPYFMAEYDLTERG